jgi:hypothetical protein
MLLLVNRLSHLGQGDRVPTFPVRATRRAILPVLCRAPYAFGRAGILGTGAETVKCCDATAYALVKMWSRFGGP